MTEREAGRDRHQPIGLADGQRAQQQRVDHAEERGVGAHPEGERENGGGRKNGRVAQRAPRRAEILHRASASVEQRAAISWPEESIPADEREGGAHQGDEQHDAKVHTVGRVGSIAVLSFLVVSGVFG